MMELGADMWVTHTILGKDTEFKHQGPIFTGLRYQLHAIQEKYKDLEADTQKEKKIDTH